jgi:hypothetical protein
VIFGVKICFRRVCRDDIFLNRSQPYLNKYLLFGFAVLGLVSLVPSPS